MELLRAGKYQDALIELNKALSLHARSPKVLTARAQVYLKLGKKDLAKADNKLASSASDADKTYGLDAQGNPLKSDSIFEPRAKWK
jgi:Tfp pilus assembly protein PilF